MNTRIEYLYRDGSNYKRFQSVAVEGKLTDEEMEEVCISGSFTNIPFREFYGNIAELNQTVREYERNSKRNKYAAEHDKITKHMMHLIRLYLMALDILNDGKIITYRAKERDFLMDIRNGKYMDESGQPTKEFFDIVKDYENQLVKAKERSVLPERVDQTKVDKLFMEIYERFVF